MGDHRASIKIGMDAHGQKYEYDGWINWCPDETGCDPRIYEWFAECWRDAYARYDAEMFEASKERREAETKKSELAELARLKEKYEAAPPKDGE